MKGVKKVYPMLFMAVIVLLLALAWLYGNRLMTCVRKQDDSAPFQRERTIERRNAPPQHQLYAYDPDPEKYDVDSLLFPHGTPLINCDTDTKQLRKQLKSKLQELSDANIRPGEFAKGEEAEIRYHCVNSVIADVVKLYRALGMTDAANHWLPVYAWTLEIGIRCDAIEQYSTADEAYRLYMALQPPWTLAAKRAAQKHAEFLLKLFREGGDWYWYILSDGTTTNVRSLQSPPQWDNNTLTDALEWFQRADYSTKQRQEIKWKALIEKQLALYDKILL